MTAANQRTGLRRGLWTLCALGASVLVAATGFLFHLNLSTAGSLELLLVLLTALQLGFFEATVASVSAVLCLNFLFTEPVFRFTVADSRNWISLFTFEITALLVSGLSTKARLHSARAEEERIRAMQLYELSRAVLLLNQGKPIGPQMSALLLGALGIEDAGFWVRFEEGDAQPREGRVAEAHDAYLADKDSHCTETGMLFRVLRSGVSSIGGMALYDPKLDLARADAIASLAAIAFERAHAVRQENRAEVQRDAEQLRTAVLDGLAHGFKTPLTAIQAASSGLLAMGKLSSVQTELIALIDERATMLSQLTTRLLQTASLDVKLIRLHRSRICLGEVIDRVVREQEPEVRSRVRIHTTGGLKEDDVDVPMIELALQQLLDNAAKYSPVGSEIEIKVKQEDDETAMLVQNRSKAGWSLAPDDKLKIFERFYRGDSPDNRPPGTGLGLSVVKKTAEAHGGRVWAEALEGMTTFGFVVQRLRKEHRG